MSASVEQITPAAEITARLDRLPMTRHIWMMVLLIALGGTFENYDIFFTGYIAPGLFEAKIFTATTTGLFGTTGLIGFYGFVNWVPTLLINKGITITKSLEYTFIIAPSFRFGR